MLHKKNYSSAVKPLTDLTSDYPPLCKSTKRKVKTQQVTVVTDSNPVKHVLSTAKLDALSYRWLAALSTFTFSIEQANVVDVTSLEKQASPLNLNSEQRVTPKMC